MKVYAASVYDNPGCVSFEEFEEDYLRIKSLKVLFSKYINNKKVNLRIVLNHIICISNVFPGATATILFAETNPEYWDLLATLLYYLNLLPVEDIKINGAPISLSGFTLDGRVLQALQEL